MSSHRARFLIIAVAVVALTFVLTGCVKPTTNAPASTAAVDDTPTASVQETGTESSATTQSDASAPITTPAAGSALRKALLDAAREKLGSSTSFYVYQLYVQGDTALGDLEPVSTSAGPRVFVAWERANSEWTAVTTMKFGSSDANAASAARALPSFSDKLISKINWTLAAKPKTKTTNVTSSSLKTSLSKAAKAWTKTELGGEFQPYSVPVLHVAKDKKGAWWGRAITQPKGGERLEFWARYADGAWDGSVQDVETPPPGSYFPTSVISKLGF